VDEKRVLRRAIVVRGSAHSATAGDLAEAIDVRLELSQKRASFLREAKLVKLIGRRGRANLYAAGS